MLSSIPYGTFANYSPRGSSARSLSSQKICGNIKAGSLTQLEKALPLLQGDEAAVLAPFLNPGVTLVPVPRSAPLAKGALWPGDVIAKFLRDAGFGGDVLPCIERVTAVQKSSSSEPGERPMVADHYQSFEVKNDILPPAQITLVDDVLTQGRTMFACAMRLHEAYPNADIRAFAMIRTQGFIPEIEKIGDPSVGVIKYFAGSGKTFRDP